MTKVTTRIKISSTANGKKQNEVYQTSQQNETVPGESFEKDILKEK